MQKDFSIIAELRALREQKSRLSRREADLSRAQLSDVDLIPRIYGWYTAIQGRRGKPLMPEDALFKRQFVFIIMFLYSPGALAGVPANRGVRYAVAKVMGMKSKTYVSNLCNEAMLYYKNYKDFRRDVGKVYELILGRLMEEGEGKEES